MKTHTHTKLTYTHTLADGTEIELELPVKPDCIMDFKDVLVKETADTLTIGYLAHDSDCNNPLEDDEGAGSIYEARRHGSTLADYERALGLADGGPNLDLVDEDQAVERALQCILNDPADLARAAEYCRQHWDQPDGRGDDRFVEDCLDSINELTPIFDMDALLTEMWQEGREAGTIGDKHAVLLDVYEHGQVSYSVSGSGPQCQFDTARAGAVFVPDAACLEHINSFPEAEQRAAAVQCAESACKEYTDWRNGNCFGVVQVTYDLYGKLISEDTCWGYIGDDYAYDELKSLFKEPA